MQKPNITKNDHYKCFFVKNVCVKLKKKKFYFDIFVSLEKLYYKYYFTLRFKKIYVHMNKGIFF